MARKSKGKRCLDCGKRISDTAKRCKSCAKKLPKEDGKPRLAWRYDCPCGIVAYSFDGVPFIIDTAGHEVKRGARVIYNSRKLYDYCPACGFSPDDHAGERKNEMLYEAQCPAGQFAQFGVVDLPLESILSPNLDLLGIA